MSNLPGEIQRRSVSHSLIYASAALLTPRGRGAVAVIRYLGPCERIDAVEFPLFRAANGRPLDGQTLQRVVFGQWGKAPFEEAVVVCRRSSDEMEIHCHGGAAAAQRILQDLAERGVAVKSWRELQTEREGIFVAECTLALSQATTLKTVSILLEQQTGTLETAVLQLSASPWTTEGRGAAESLLDSLLSWSTLGLHLTKPWTVVLAGRPNAGKSSLINALLGYARSVVFDQPGTTRDVVTAETAFAGWPIRLADTAGIRRDAADLEAAGISRAEVQLATADCRVLVLDPSREPHADDWQLLHAWPDAIVVANKSDLATIWEDSLLKHSLPVSAKTGSGIAELSQAIIAQLVPMPPPPGTAMPVTDRQVACLHEAQSAFKAGIRPAFDAALAQLLGHTAEEGSGT